MNKQNNILNRTGTPYYVKKLKSYKSRFCKIIYHILTFPPKFFLKISIFATVHNIHFISLSHIIRRPQKYFSLISREQSERFTFQLTRADAGTAKKNGAGVGTCLADVAWRSDRDSNSGYAFDVYTLSRRASSATRASLLALNAGHR